MRKIKFRAWNKKIKSMGSALPLDVLIYDCTDINYNDLEIMQYTGLKDKNGKEIYEGDIVLRRDTADDYKEKWSSKNYTIFYDSEKAKYRLKEESDVWGLIWKMEVIGNIYENPELIEK